MLIESAELQRELRAHVERLVERIELPAVALTFADWWAGLAPQVELRDDPASLVSPVTVSPVTVSPVTVSPATIVSVDALRTAASPTAPLAADGRLLFVEVVEGPGVQHFDVSGYLWSCGMSVIDVVRPVINAADGDWEFAIGIARHTPERQTPPAFAESPDESSDD